MKSVSIVFYAENKASMNHYRSLISEITEVKKLQICSNIVTLFSKPKSLVI